MRVVDVDRREKTSSLRVIWPDAINQEANFRQVTTEPGIDRPVLFLSMCRYSEYSSSALKG